MTHEAEMADKVAGGSIVHHIQEPDQEPFHEEISLSDHLRKISMGGITTEKTPLLTVDTNVPATNEPDPFALDYDHVVNYQREPESVWDEIKGIVRLSIPMVGSQAVADFPSIANGWLLGNAPGSDSAKILAASSLATFLQGQVVYTLASGINSAMATVCTQSYGANQMQQICLYTQAGVLAAGYSVAVAMLVCVNGASVFKMLGQDAELADLAGIFTTFHAISAPFIFVDEMARCLLPSQHRVAPLVYIPILSNIVALPLAYMLGFHTGLSYIGIALAGVLYPILKVTMEIPILLKTPAFVDGWPGWKWKEAHALMTTMLPLGISSVLMVMSQNIGLILVSVTCGYLPNPARAIAADNTANSLLSIAIVPLIGVSTSGMIRVGTAIGAGKQQNAIVGSYVAIGFTISVAVLSAVVSSAFAGSFSDGYTTDAPTADLATAVYPAQAALVVLLGGMFGIQSVLRVCGKQAVVAKLNFLFLFVISIPLGLVLAIPLKLGLIGLYLGEIISMGSLNVACWVYVYRFDWDAVTREAYVNSHLHVEKEPKGEPIC